MRGDVDDNDTAISTARWTNVTNIPVRPPGRNTVPFRIMYGRTFVPNRTVSGASSAPPTVY